MTKSVLPPPLQRTYGTGKKIRSQIAGVSRENDGTVAPFPRERFLKFCSVLKIQSKDYGLIILEFNGTQRRLLDEVC